MEGIPSLGRDRRYSSSTPYTAPSAVISAVAVSVATNRKLLHDNIHINRLRLTKDRPALDPRVDEHAVEIRMGRGDSAHLLLAFSNEIVGVGHITYSDTNFGISPSLLISNCITAALSSPCFWINASRFSFLRPTPITKQPWLIRRSARMRPIPVYTHQHLTHPKHSRIGSHT